MSVSKIDEARPKKSTFFFVTVKTYFFVIVITYFLVIAKNGFLSLQKKKILSLSKNDLSLSKNFCSHGVFHFLSVRVCSPILTPYSIIVAKKCRNVCRKFLIAIRNESQPSVFVHTAAQEAYAQPGNGRPNNDAEDEGLADLNGDEDEEEKETDPRPGHQGAIPKTPKPNYAPPNYVPK